MRYAWNSFHYLVLPLLALLMGASMGYAQVNINGASWSKSAGQLTVSGKTDAGSAVEIHDANGRLLGTVTPEADGKFQLQVGDQYPELLCRVRAKTGAEVAEKAVAGSPNKHCSLVPRCGILSPVSGTRVAAHADVRFTATAKLKGRKAKPLKLEWDFGGGSMGEPIPGSNPLVYKRPDTESTTIQFVRDNSRYRVRFTAMDGKRRYCEDAIEVIVGSPPEAPPGVAMLASQSVDFAPARGSGSNAQAGEVVILPFQEWTMQGQTDTRYTPGSFAVINPLQTNLGAVAYRKGRIPQRLTDTELSLRFTAAANPQDPVGRESINSTSQNWPLGGDIRVATPMMTARIRKTDLWETLANDDYRTFAAAQIFGRVDDLPSGTVPDQAYPIRPDLDELSSTWPNALPTVADGEHGTRMPGYENPYVNNQPVEFTAFLHGKGSFLARTIPITDIDDQGRVNPFPLLRVTAISKATGQTLAATDAVLATGKDMHCRECHAQGQIAANPATPWSDAAWHYSYPNWDGTFGGAPEWWEGAPTQPAPPRFFAAQDPEGKPSLDPFDEEYAALLNIASLHDFYDAASLFHSQNGGKNGPFLCSSCHMSRITGWPAGGIDQNPAAEYVGRTPPTAGPLHADDYYNPDYSSAIHKFHGLLQVSAAGDVIRNADGVPLRWDVAKGRNPNTLFPVTDEQGVPLPMERNCLRCHSGHREPLYRDRMYTAGVTCYQCHGDMLAMGKAAPKARVNPDGLHFRTDWFDQPDCGSCHVGSGNLGRKDSQFFSEGVMKTAFDPADLAATPRAVDLGNPDAARFAVVPYTALEFPSTYAGGPAGDGDWKGGGGAIETIRTRLYREGKDTHGDVPCAACHGGAHGVWPNRDPKANDNLTAQQLQGHAGPIAECRVCHADGAFQKQEDLDAGRFRTDLPANSGVLGGPHDMHPIDDPVFWKEVKGVKGGWHISYSKKPGKVGEDQCAACHGNDHRGTRLSKTPVDRIFDFSGMPSAKLKSKIVRVAAGTPIGCQTCHSIELSCKESPAGADCGRASSATTASTNRSPVFDLLPAATGIIGEPTTYQVHATDPDGDPLTYSVSRRPDDMLIDPVTGRITTAWPPALLFWPWETGVTPSAFEYPYVVTASDGRGGYATQRVDVKLSCPEGRVWGVKGCTQTSVGGVNITSRPDIIGINVGELYQYQIVATDAANLPLTYGLIGQPAGMSVNETGLITWTVPNNLSGSQSFQVKVTNSAGGSATQPVSVTVCAPPTQWYPDHGHCM